MKKLLILLITFSFATELEVDGTLKVTGGIDAQGQPISNVGNPVNASDAIPMSAVSGVVTNAMSLAGMNPPERIYRYETNGEDFSFTVPEGKIWKVKVISTGTSGILKVNNVMYYVLYYRGAQSEFIIMPGDVINKESSHESGLLFNIYEYSFTSSGTDQGMDYVEP